MRHTIPPPRTPMIPAIPTRRIDTNIAEHKVPAPLGHDFLRANFREPHLLNLALLGSFSFHTLFRQARALLQAKTRLEFAFGVHELRMWDAVIGGEEVIVESAAGVGAGEVAGFGDGDEELLAGGRVDDEVVDGFVGDGAFVSVGGY